MESEGKLKDYLLGLEVEGTVESAGSFKLDPHRAVELLREQGRLGKGAPLFLLAAIYKHNDGSQVTLKHGVMSTQLSWETENGPIPPTVELILAEESFLAHGLILKIHDQSATLRSNNKLQPVLGSIVHDLFEEVQERTRFYPFSGRAGHSTAWKTQSAPELEIRLLAGPDRRGRVDWIVDGLKYQGSWSLPVDCQLFAQSARPDITLSVLPDSDAKAEALKKAKSFFLEGVRELVDGLESFTVLNSEGRHSEEQEHFLRFLPFLAARGDDCPVRERALKLVTFFDLFDKTWSLKALLESYKKRKSLLVMPSVPKTCPSAEKVDQLVILWDGPTKDVLRRVFARVSSAAGYLYSLERNETETNRVKKIQKKAWAERDFEDGHLILIPWDNDEDPAQVQFIGKRRSAETFYLPDSAPRGLKILWTCQREVGSLSPQEMVTERFQLEILGLLNDALENEHKVSSENSRKLLSWIRPPLETLRELKFIWRKALFRDLADVEQSLETLDRLHSAEGCLKVLKNLSTTLPDLLPEKLVLWYDELLDHLGFQTESAGRELREAHWKADGRARWLERYRPSQPELPASRPVGAHLVAKANPQEPSTVTIWREGRPLGAPQRWGGPENKGFEIVYVDDEFPADPYWAGPRHEEMGKRTTEFDKLCEDFYLVDWN